jgi:hypothetical protein
LIKSKQEADSKSVETINCLTLKIQELEKEKASCLNVIACFEKKRDTMIKIIHDNFPNISPITRVSSNTQPDVVSLNSTLFLFNDDTLNESTVVNLKLNQNQNELTHVTSLFNDQTSTFFNEYFGYIEWKAKDESLIIKTIISGKQHK